MMKPLLIILSLLIAVSALAAPKADPLCREFKYIQKTMRAINVSSVDRVIPHNDWLDRRYRREDMITAGTTVARTVILVLINRLTFITFLFTPTRAEAATVTGSYVRSPEGFVRFLELSPERACPILSYGGSEGQLLRDTTHEIYLELRRASR